MNEQDQEPPGPIPPACPAYQGWGGMRLPCHRCDRPAWEHSHQLMTRKDPFSDGDEAEIAQEWTGLMAKARICWQLGGTVEVVRGEDDGLWRLRMRSRAAKPLRLLESPESPESSKPSSTPYEENRELFIELAKETRAAHEALDADDMDAWVAHAGRGAELYELIAVRLGWRDELDAPRI